MTRFALFFENIQKDLKTYLFLLGLLCLLRGFFIFILREYMDTQSLSEIALAMWSGFRLSLKSAGVMVAVSFLVCTIANVGWPTFRTNRLRLYLGLMYILCLSLLFMARIPYYREFHTTFNQNIYNTANDDIYAIFITMLQNYNLLARFFGGLLFAAALYYCFKLFVFTPVYQLPQFSAPYKNRLFRGLIIVVIPVFIVFMRFGGSFNYNHSINWENAALTTDTFLNEAVLDDIQALYRAYSVNKRMTQGDKAVMINKDKIFEYAKMAAGNDMESRQMQDYLLRHAAGAKLAKPRHIFIILGETYAQWPLLERYDGLHIADGLKKIIRQDNAVYVSSFLPNGSFTAMAIEAMVTGLSDVAIPANYQPRSYNEAYITALAPQMHRLGYKVDFWYGGFPSWERIKDFTLAQGFDHFYGCADMGAEPDNIWGTKDGNIFMAISQKLSQEEPTVHVILTVSNHPPYNMALDEEGFEPATVAGGLPVQEKNNQELIRKLGHYWYMDKVIHDFVIATKEKYPDSLFVITGDHADRVNIDSNPPAFERYSIPLVFYGQGITKDTFPPNIAGGQVNIMPTLVELIAPQGFTYYSIGESLTKNNKVGFNNAYWITPHVMGKIDHPDQYEIVSETDQKEIRREVEDAQDKLAMMRTISWWLLMKGNQL